MCSHTRVHGCGAERLQPDGLAGLAQSVTEERLSHTHPDLGRVAVQRLEKSCVDVAVSSREVGHLEHDPRIPVHRPEALRSPNALPGFVGRGAQTFTPEKVAGEFASIAIVLKPRDQRFPGLPVAAMNADSPPPQEEGDAENRNDLEGAEQHSRFAFFPEPAQIAIADPEILSNVTLGLYQDNATSRPANDLLGS